MKLLVIFFMGIGFVSERLWDAVGLCIIAIALLRVTEQIQTNKVIKDIIYRGILIRLSKITP